MCSYCNHTHSFVSVHTMVYVCPHCRSILKRGVSYAGSTPEESFRVEEDMSVFRLGSVLTYGSAEYIFIGRFQYFYNNAVKSKWVLRNDADELLYLIEQPGFYAICKKHPVNLSSYELSCLAPGYEFVMEENKKPVFLESLYNNYSTRMEGELPDQEQNENKHIAADFTNGDGGYVFAQVFDKRNNTVYTGTYSGFVRLNFKHTRLTDEWK